MILDAEGVQRACAVRGAKKPLRKSMAMVARVSNVCCRWGGEKKVQRRANGSIASRERSVAAVSSGAKSPCNIILTRLTRPRSVGQCW